jgi:uncharacterized protein (TIGR02452 family)
MCSYEGSTLAESAMARLRTVIAQETINSIQLGSFSFGGEVYPLPLSTPIYYSPEYQHSDPDVLPVYETQIDIVEISTLQGARLLALAGASRIGVLNFASAKNPGGGFLRGTQAQEESIARSSTLYPSLTSSTSQPFYALHRPDPRRGYYSHAMIYSPDILIFRDDDGGWAVPVKVDVLTSPAVNAGIVRKRHQGDVEPQIEHVMRERMTRILSLFEKHGATDLVLGSFGTGIFKNNVDMVANLWKDLLLGTGTRFEHSFQRVVFAILGAETFRTFKEVFEARVPESST